jgi:hypothetical protein
MQGLLLYCQGIYFFNKVHLICVFQMLPVCQWLQSSVYSTSYVIDFKNLYVSRLYYLASFKEEHFLLQEGHSNFGLGGLLDC